MEKEGAKEIVERLRGLVQRHQICYEVWPEFLMVDGGKIKVGFNLQLYGTHAHGESRMSPGCERCVQTFNDLRQVADYIMPKEERSSRYEIEPYDRALHESATRQFRAEVGLSMKILHRYGFDQPVDECEQSCLKEMRKALAGLGVPQGKWRKERR